MRDATATPRALLQHENDQLRQQVDALSRQLSEAQVKAETSQRACEDAWRFAQAVLKTSRTVYT